LPTHPDLLAAFAAGLRDGTLPPGLTADERRFAVYRNTVVVGLAGALSQRFAVIERLVGAEFFAAMGRIYQEAHRPKSPVLQEWGDTFPGFLAEFPPLAAYPYMADVARIELARGRAYHAADADPLSGQLAAGARFGLHPSVQVLRLAHPAVSIWAANQPGAEERPIEPGPEIALILRDARFNVPVAGIDADDAALIEGLLAGAGTGWDPQPILMHLMRAGVLTLANDP
jgi:hypothetical protein